LLLARVTGSVVATRKEPELEGIKFLLVENTDPEGKGKGTFVVAADAVGAGLGDLVLYATGSSARQTTLTKDRPCDATIMAIVDLVEEQGSFQYRKDAE
jgi:microcompartment protein CcmK/EutM